MKPTDYNHRINIYKKFCRMNDDARWEEENALWKTVWANVKPVKNSSDPSNYVFKIKWQSNFPKNFNVSLRNDMFNVKTHPIIDPDRSWIMFFGNKVKE